MAALPGSVTAGSDRARDKSGSNMSNYFDDKKRHETNKSGVFPKTALPEASEHRFSLSPQICVDNLTEVKLYVSIIGIFSGKVNPRQKIRIIFNSNGAGKILCLRRCDVISNYWGIRKRTL